MITRTSLMLSSRTLPTQRDQQRACSRSHTSNCCSEPSRRVALLPHKVVRSPLSAWIYAFFILVFSRSFGACSVMLETVCLCLHLHLLGTVFSVSALQLANASSFSSCFKCSANLHPRRESMDPPPIDHQAQEGLQGDFP
jgi:hypothetical protein